MPKNDAVAKTIQVYEEEADKYFQTHDQIGDIEKQINLFIDIVPGKKVFDIGCGPGRDSKYLSNHGFDVAGIDLTKKFVEIAGKNATKAKILQMDMRDIKFASKTFDGIWACASFLHIPKEFAQNTIKGFARVLKKGGLLYLSVKSGDSEKMVVNPLHPDKEIFFAFWNDEELKNLINSCDFDIERILIDEKKDGWINIFATKK